MSDDDLRIQVKDELLWEPSVDDRAIAVGAHDGTVELRGTVSSFGERRRATEAAKRVYGVNKVENDLDVKLLNDERRDDADLRGSVLQALQLDGMVPSTVDAKVSDGTVTLTGTAPYQFQRAEAEYIAGNVPGVFWVDNDIVLRVPVATDDVEDAIRKALERDAKVDAKGVSVATSNGTVTLSGSVASWAEHDSAVAATWAAPGVTDVRDRLLVNYF